MALESNKSQNKQNVQYMENASWHSTLEILTRLGLGFDGSNLVMAEADDMQTYVVTSGSYTYVCKAAVGTALATAGWKIFRIDTSGSKLYADGNANYDNVASDPTSLTYSYT